MKMLKESLEINKMEYLIITNEGKWPFQEKGNSTYEEVETDEFQDGEVVIKEFKSHSGLRYVTIDMYTKIKGSD